MSALAVVGAALAAAVVTLILYLLRPPARRLVVPSVLIWERVLRGSKRESDRLRWWLSLLLAGTIAVLIAVAALGPQTVGMTQGKGRTVVVLDNSPTMAALTTDGGTRFDQARAEARQLIEALPAGAEVMIADTQRQIATPYFERRDSALELLGGLQPGQQKLARVPDVAATVGAGKRYVISDGVLLRDVPPDFVAVSIFEAVENVGLSAFDIEMVPGSPRRYQAFLEVTNAGASDKPVTLEIAGSGAQRINRELVLPAATSITQIVDISAFDGGPVRAALVAPGDALTIDDVAYGFLPLRRLIRVTLVTPGSEYLVKSLTAQPRVSLRVVTPGRYVDRGDTDLYVFDRFAPRMAPRAPAVLFSPGNAAWIPSPSGVVAEPGIAVSETVHPVLQNISLRDLYIEKATPAQPGADTNDTVLLRTRGGGALALAHDGAQRWLWLGFDLEHSNFALHAAFPAFLNNAIGWLAGEPMIVRHQPGAVSIGLDKARVVAMDGSEPRLTTFDKETRFDADQPGIYTAVNADSRIRILVSVLDRDVTGVNTSRLAEIDPASRAQKDAREFRLPLDGWTMLLLLAAVLLILEWASFNRRVTL